MRGFEFDGLWNGLHSVADPTMRVDSELRILRAARDSFCAGITFAMPTQGEVRAETMVCVDRAMRVLQRQGVPTALAMNAQTLLPDCREQIAEECVMGPKLAMTLWVDSDMTFESDTIWMLYQRAQDFYRYVPSSQPAKNLEHAQVWAANLRATSFWVWGCPYMTRGLDPRLCLEPLPDDQGNLWIEEMEKLYEQVEVAGVGLGLAFVPTVAMALLPTPLFERPWVGSGYRGEDLAFCDRIRDAGGQILVDFSVPAPGHLVVTEKTLSNYHAQVKAKHQAREAKREAWGERGESSRRDQEHLAGRGIAPDFSPDSPPRPAIEPVTPEGQNE